MKKMGLILLLAALLMTLGGCASTSRYYSMGTKQFTEIDYGFPVNYVDVRNLRIGYIDQGRGDKVLLLIHGLGSNAKGWSRNIPDLAQHYRVIAVDLPGYGYSSKDYYPYSMSFYAQALCEMLTKLGVDKAVWVGHSMGGQIAITAALDDPDRVEELILISPAGIESFTEGEKDWFRKVAVPELTTAPGPRQIDINLRHNFYNTPKAAEFMITDRISVRGASDFPDYAYAVAQNIKAMVNEPTTDRLHLLTQPVLVLFGRQDQLIPNTYLHGGNSATIGAMAKKLIPNCTLKMVDQCGHFVQFEQHRVTDAAIIDFLYTK